MLQFFKLLYFNTEPQL